MPRSYVCKKLKKMITSLDENERRNLGASIINYINKRRLSTISMESVAKKIVISKIKLFAEDPSSNNKNELIKLISYLQEGFESNG